jgi:hypothetical protein
LLLLQRCSRPLCSSQMAGGTSNPHRCRRGLGGPQKFGSM